MRFLIISDIHSNLEALVAVFSELHNQNEQIDRVLMLGDIVGYGVNPNECCTIIKFLKSGKPTLEKEIQTIIQSIDIGATERENIINYLLSLGKKSHHYRRQPWSTGHWPAKYSDGFICRYIY